MTDDSSTSSYEADIEFAELVEVMTQQLQAGIPVNEESLVATYPRYAKQLRELLPALRMLALDRNEVFGDKQQRQLDAPSPGRPKELGDYRLIREIGRGGMGVVYEAHQISLDKRVALKMLPFAAILDPRSLQRFKNEARAAAQLQHANIVPVYAVGHERGIHYYAMRYIEGANLAQVINDVRGDSAPTEDFNDEGPLAMGTVVEQSTPSEASRFTNLLKSSKSKSSARRGYYAGCARLGIQAAEALHYAHAWGVVHRDVKPSNLLLDVEGNVWVTDFGLAQVQGNPGLTLTGHLIGSLRYMSPEQIHASHMVVDHRADIYSLGLTLYELLTHRHAFEGKDRVELLRQIASDDPPVPRQIDRRIPIDLETIVLKAIAKNADDRYQTALDFAEDLRRFQEDRPIRARRTTLVQWARKWARRHTGLVVSAIVVLAVVFVAAVVVSVALLDAYHTQKAELKRSEGQRLTSRALLERSRNPGLAMGLAMEGVRLYPDHETNNALLAVLDANYERRTLIGHVTGVGTADFDPRGDRVITTASANWFSAKPPEPARIWDPVTGRTLLILDDGSTITSAVFSPDGGRVLTTSSPVALRNMDDTSHDRTSRPPSIWDATTGKKLDGPADALADAFLLSVHAGVFSPNGEWIVVPVLGHAAKVLDVITGREQLTLEGHTQRVIYASFSPNGRKIVTVSDDNTVIIWDAHDGKQLHRIDWWQGELPHSDRSKVNTAVFNPDASRLLTASRRHGVQIWSLAGGDPHVSEPIKPGRTWTGDIARFSPDGDLILTYSRLGTEVDVYDAETLAASRKLLGGFDHLRDARFSTDSRSIVVCDNNVVSLWSAATGEQLAELRGHEDNVTAAAFSPDANYVVSVSDDQTARVWHTTSREERSYFTAKLDRATHPIVNFSPDGTQLLVASRSKYQTAVLDLTTKRLRFLLPGRVAPADSSGTRLLTVEDNRLAVSDLRTGSEINAFAVDVDTFESNARLSADGRHVLTPLRDGRTCLWDVDSGSQMTLGGPTDSVRAVAFRPDGDKVATGDTSGLVCVWNTRTGEKLRDLRVEGVVLALRYSSDGDHLLVVTSDGRGYVWRPDDRGQVVQIGGGSITHAAFSFDGQHVITYAWSEHAVQCWDTVTGDQIARLAVALRRAESLHVHPFKPEVLIASQDDGLAVWNFVENGCRQISEIPTSAAVFSADGKQIIAALASQSNGPNRLSADKASEFVRPVFQVRSADTGELIAEVDNSVGSVCELQVVPQPAAVIVGVECYGISLQSVATRRELRWFGGHAASLSFAAFTPDGTKVVTCSLDQRAAIWNARTGERLHWLNGHGAAIHSAAISSDGRWLATGDADGCVVISDLTTGKPAPNQPEGQAGLVTFIEFSPDGQRLLIGSNNGSLHIWDSKKTISVTRNDKATIAWAELSNDGRLLTMPGAIMSRRAHANGIASSYADTSTRQSWSIEVSQLAGGKTVTLRHQQPPKMARFSPLGDRIVTVATDGTSSLWDAYSGELLHSLGRSVSYAEFSPDGNHLMTEQGNGISLWEARTGSEIWTVIGADGHHSFVSSTVGSHWQPRSASLLIGITREARVRSIPFDPLLFAEQALPRLLTAEDRARFNVHDWNSE